MLKKLNLNTKGRVFLPILLAVIMILSIAPASFALNGQGTKSVNVLGYQYMNSSSIKIFFDKNIPTTNLSVGLFTIKDSSNNSVSISSFNRANGSGWTNAYAPTGTTVTLSLGQSLNYDADYTVTVSHTITANNGLTLGYYLNDNDVVFSIHTPSDSAGNYDTGDTPSFSFVPNFDNTDFSMSVLAISDMPIDTSSYTLSDVKLQKYDSSTSTWNDVTRDTSFDLNATTGAECYTAQINDANTCLFLPMSLGGSSTPAYDLLSTSTDYRLVIPSAIEATTGENYGTTSFEFATDSTRI